MSGIKTLLGDGATGVDDFDLGEDFGRYAMGQQLLPILKSVREEVSKMMAAHHSDVSGAPLGRVATALMYRTRCSKAIEDLDAVIKDIERPPKEAPAEPIGAMSDANDIPF